VTEQAHEVQAARKQAAPAPAVGGTGMQSQLLRLHRQAGNRAVGQLLARQIGVQRVAVTAPTTQETLFNQPGGGTASPNVYGGSGGATFDITRGGSPEAFTVTVKIRFIDQQRTLQTDATGKQYAADTGDKHVIPANDPRRAFGQNICDRAPTHWNNRAVLVSNRQPKTGLSGYISPDPGGPVRLPLVFRSVPVWDLTSPADKEIRLFGTATQAGGPTNPIDAGHYYMNKGPNYPFDEEAIYAHEYGHLIGLNDEYSQSNPQMHALLHGVDPATSAARGEALDRETVRRMVIAALTRPLQDRINAAGNEIAASFTAGRAPVRAALGSSLRGALSDSAILGLFQANLPPATAKLTPAIPGLVRAAARSAANTTAVAGSVVSNEFAAAAIAPLVSQLYWHALMGAQGAANVGGVGIHINIQGNAGITATGQAVIPATGIWNAAATGPMAANAGSIVDHVAGPLKTGRIPPVRPSGSILRQLESLPAGWAGFAKAAPATLSAGTLQADIGTALGAAWAAQLVATMAGMAPSPPPIAARAALRQAIGASVHTAAVAAATNAVRAFLNDEINPILTSSVTALMAAIGDEVTRIMGTPAEQLALTSTRDPDVAAMASNLSAQLKAQVAAAQAAQAAAPGSTAINPGTTAPPQQVTYGTVGMMSDNTEVFRQDEFTHLATLVNGKSELRHDREDAFTVQMV
jgi:hypothetical protein